MELRQLRYFVKVAETLNFSDAARALCITQSTLSQQIKQLENELGVPLLHRTSHQVLLTEAGQEILSGARQALQAAEMCTERIADLTQMRTGTLNIGATYSFSPILTETIQMFMKAYPAIKLNISYNSMAQLMEQLRQRAVDLVLAFKPLARQDGIESHVLFQNRLVAVVSPTHPLAELESVTASQLERYDFALLAKGMQARNAFDHFMGPWCNPRVRIELNEVNILLHLIRNSSLVTVLAEACIYGAQGLRAVPIENLDIEMSGCVHTLRDTCHKQSMRHFVEMLDQSVAVRTRRSAWL